MATFYVDLLLLVAMSGWLYGTSTADVTPIGESLNRNSFPDGFIFGAGTSAYQYEGAWNEDGKGPNNWDTFTHQYPEKITDGNNSDLASDFYHRYKEDVALLKEMGGDAFRFSISWSRILPYGSLSGGINEKGVQHYKDLIREIISQGMIPFATLFHWDTPQALEDKYGGFLSSSIINDYLEFVDICFKEFGDNVKHWVTFNEPLIFSLAGYGLGQNAPGRCTPGVPPGDCTVGNSGSEPYIVSHNQLLAHAAAVKLYREEYQAAQMGKIGITLVTTWYLPLSDTNKSDADAFQRATDFFYGWFMDPITHGDYPFIMRALIGDRLPSFTVEQSKLLIGSFDFIGLNYYSSSYIYGLPFSYNVKKNYLTDFFIDTTVFRDGVAIGPMVGTDFYIYPKGIQYFLLYTKEKYNNPVIYITENGVDEINNASIPLTEALNDIIRVEFHKSHLLDVLEAIRKGVDVRGYFVWALMDGFEWKNGFTQRFGLHYVDYARNLTRYPKRSALWFRKFLSYRGSFSSFD